MGQNAQNTQGGINTPSQPQTTDSDLSPEEIAALDPRIREWVLSPNYTVVSQSRPSLSTSGKQNSGNNVSSSRSTSLPPPTTSKTDSIQNGSDSDTKSNRTNQNPTNRSSNGIVTIVPAPAKPTVLEPELVALNNLKHIHPIHYKSRLKSAFPPEFKKEARKELDSIELFKLLQHYQLRLNDASVSSMDIQNDILKKISAVDHECWIAANKVASCGVLMNALETQLSEAWNVQKSLEKTKNRLTEAIKSIDKLLDSLPDDIKEQVAGTNFPFNVAPHLTKEFYFNLNYYSTIIPESHQIGYQKLESVWVHEILPFWESAIITKQAKQLWRKGIPPKLRAYIWKKVIGNRLNMNREMYYEFLQHNSTSKQEDNNPDAREYQENELSNPDALPDSESNDVLSTINISNRKATGKDVRPLISRDVARTFSKIGIFKTPGTPPHDDLVNVLEAVTFYRPELSYVQGQSFLAGILLMYMPVDDVFVTLTNLLDHHFFRSFCKFDLPAIQVHVEAYESLLRTNIPQLSAHFKELHLEPEQYLFDWYVTLFSKPLPIQLSGVIWDCYIMEGPLIVPLITISILKQYASRLLQFNFEETMRLLRQLPEDMDLQEMLQGIDSLAIPSLVRKLFAPIWNESM